MFDEQVANLDNCVDIVPYGMSGMAYLMENVAANLDNQCNAYILQNHGILCLGTTIDKAVLNILQLEKSVRIYYHHTLTSGKPVTVL